MLKPTRGVPVENSELSGGCACGSIRFVASGPPDWVGICHCASCRRATGGISIAAAGFSKSRVRLDGATLAKFASSPGVLRSFCSVCGTSLSYESERWADDIHLMVGAFDAPERLTPQFHLFFDDRLPCEEAADALPKYRTTPSAGLLVEP